MNVVSTWTLAVVLVSNVEFAAVKLVVAPSNVIELSWNPAPKAQDHDDRVRRFMRTSCQVVPVVFVARRRRMPSGSASGRPPLRRPSTVGVGRVAGANAAGPVTVLRTSDGEPWPQYGKVQASRPRPTSTQPPPSVVMSQ